MHEFRPASRGRVRVRACDRPPRGSPVSTFAHTPVMLREVLSWLDSVPTGLVIDATCGGAGHAAALLDDRTDQHLLGLDQDPLAVRTAAERLVRFGSRAHVRSARFDAVAHVVEALRHELANEALPVVGILFDLGVSSAQFDVAERGFSYRNDAPLDMRMNTTTGPTAADIVNTASVSELRRVIRTYSDERFADRIARAIVAQRPILTTAHLSEVGTTAIPAATRRTGGHPAKRTFQALRIEVNDELRVLERALDSAIELLGPGGRCVVLSYHSGEDRIVKDRFRVAETGGCSCPPGLPCVCGALPWGRMVRRGVTRPTPAEIAANPRAASAVARVFERSRPSSPTAALVIRRAASGPDHSSDSALDAHRSPDSTSTAPNGPRRTEREDLR
jgi:16S rRNA (cytosine1402-N4)-methyltransferase